MRNNHERMIQKCTTISNTKMLSHVMSSQTSKYCKICNISERNFQKLKILLTAVFIVE